MSNLDQTIETHLKNIQSKTGRTLEELAVIVKQNGFCQHGEIRDLFHREMGLTYADASTLTHAILQSGTTAPSDVYEPDEMDDELIAWISLTYENAI